MTQTDNKEQRVLIVSVDTNEYDVESSSLELIELVKSAGGEVVATISQKLDHIDSSSCVKSGKLLEIKEFCENEEIDLLVFDLELSPVQLRNIENITDVRTIDRTMLILDIFALHAKTKEGKLQVELAQLKYMLPRLTGKGIEMSRLGGGIGTRGPGETKLETDKRHIHRKMESLKNQLNDVEKHRNELRKRRKKDRVITVAIVGYTNAGKSTLMNYLTDAGVLSEDKLFATLDPTSRKLKLPNGVSVMLVDTVGLVRRLPHQLVEAFKSTLEEAAFSDIILNVCDISSDEASLHLQVTNELLKSLGCENIPVIPVLNKSDLICKDDDTIRINNSVYISAKTGEGIDKLLSEIEKNLPKKVMKVKSLIPFSKASLVSKIRNEGTLLCEEYTEEGILISAIVDETIYNSILEYIIDDN